MQCHFACLDQKVALLFFALFPHQDCRWAHRRRGCRGGWKKLVQWQFVVAHHPRAELGSGRHDWKDPLFRAVPDLFLANFFLLSILSVPRCFQEQLELGSIESFETQTRRIDFALAHVHPRIACQWLRFEFLSILHPLDLVRHTIQVM